MKPDLLKIILNGILKQIELGIIIEINNQGLYINANMTGRTWALEGVILASQIEYLDFATPEYYIISLAGIRDFLYKSKAKYDILIIERENGSGNLQFTMQGVSVSKSFSVAILDLPKQTFFLNLLSLEKKLEIMIRRFSGKQLIEVVDNLNLAGENALITYRSGSITFSSTDQINSMNISINFDEDGDDNIAVLEEKDHVETMINLDFFKTLKKFLQVQDPFIFVFGDNKPVLAAFRFSNGEGYIAIGIGNRQK